jgi:hypothetical protein
MGRFSEWHSETIRLARVKYSCWEEFLEDKPREMGNHFKIATLTFNECLPRNFAAQGNRFKT